MGRLNSAAFQGAMTIPLPPNALANPVSKTVAVYLETPEEKEQTR